MSGVLSRLSPPAGSKKVAKRLGRGTGSGVGKTAGRGQKGQKARSTGNIGKKHFQGGQTPIQRRLPKRGFRNPFAVEVAIVNVGALDLFAAGTKVDEALLQGQAPSSRSRCVGQNSRQWGIDQSRDRRRSQV